MLGANKIPHGKKAGAGLAIIAAVFAYSQRSITNLSEVQKPLQTVTVCAVQELKPPLGFIVVDGGRTLEEHKINVANGKSWITRSRHQDAAAIDVAATLNGKVTYEPMYYHKINDVFQECSLLHDVPLIWGGTWKKKDYMHWELDKRFYP